MRGYFQNQYVYDPDTKRLIFLREESTPKYWESVWDVADIKEKITFRSRNDFVVKWTKKYLIPADGPILEGGCGLARNVYALQQSGFQAIGVDYAEKTIQDVKSCNLNLDIRQADIRQLPFPDAFFSGYWSLGVIEHFWEGYSAIAREIKRVLKPNGYLFLTFPYVSSLRRLKIQMGYYRFYNANTDMKKFNAFFLEFKDVIREFEKFGFVLKRKKTFGGMQGLKNDLPIFKKPFDKLSSYKNGFLPIIGVRFMLDRILALFAADMMLLIFKSQPSEQSLK